MKNLGLALLVVFCLSPAIAEAPAGAVDASYTSPLDLEAVEIVDGVAKVVSFSVSVTANPDGSWPYTKTDGLYLGSKGTLTVIGLLLPETLHECDDVYDCMEGVRLMCVENHTDRDVTKSVHIEWNNFNGTGTCTGSCSNGGTVTITCYETGH